MQNGFKVKERKKTRPQHQIGWLPCDKSFSKVRWMERRSRCKFSINFRIVSLWLIMQVLSINLWCTLIVVTLEKRWHYIVDMVDCYWAASGQKKCTRVRIGGKKSVVWRWRRDKSGDGERPGKKSVVTTQPMRFARTLARSLARAFASAAVHTKMSSVKNARVSFGMHRVWATKSNSRFLATNNKCKNGECVCALRCARSNKEVTVVDWNERKNKTTTATMFARERPTPKPLNGRKERKKNAIV